MRILYFGSCRFSRRVAEGILPSALKSKTNLDVVVPKGTIDEEGKGMLEIERFSRERGIRVHPVRFHDAGVNNGRSPFSWDVNTRDFDLGLVVSFGLFLPRRVIESFPMACLNLHPSLLPDYRGAAPIARALMDGQETSGLSVIDKLERKWSVDDAEERMAEIGASMLNDIIEKASLDPLAFQRLKNAAWDQTENSPASLRSSRRKAPKISNADSILNLETMTPHEIWNRYRALKGRFQVGLANGVKFAIIKNPYDEGLELETVDDVDADTAFYLQSRGRENRMLLFRCKDGALLGVQGFQVPGKSRLLQTHEFVQWVNEGKGAKLVKPTLKIINV